MRTEDYRRGYQAGYAVGRRSIKPLKDLSKVKVKVANWVGIDDFPHEDWECNACGFIFYGDDTVPEWAKFCPNCGATMQRHRTEDKNVIDRENYCKDCERSIYAENPSCDVNIENNGKYVGAGEKCYCKIVNGKMAEKYPWED